MKQAILTWSSNPIAEKVTAYKVYEKLSTGLHLLGSVSVDRFATGALAPGKHIFDVSAVNSAGESHFTEKSIKI